MNTAAITLAVVAGLVSLGSTIYVTRLSHRLQERDRAKTKAEQVAEVMARYRDPLLRAAFDLQSRLYNIVELGFLTRYYRDDRPEHKAYAADNTLYVLAEYLGWVEILRREVRFLDLGDEQANRQLMERLDAVRRILLADAYGDDVLQVFNGQQRAIGEIMAVPAEREGGGMACKGYAAFTACQDEPGFARWFARLRDDVEVLAREPHGHGRVIALQHALVDLVDFLDPGHERLPAGDRRKLEAPTGVARAESRPAAV